ncbi:MAG TPA: hypothetical protein VM260_26930 [Pirellula sp.]|nr:hypothetical protein [Pirellula sp.]
MYSVATHHISDEEKMALTQEIGDVTRKLRAELGQLLAKNETNSTQENKCLELTQYLWESLTDPLVSRMNILGNQLLVRLERLTNATEFNQHVAVANRATAMENQREAFENLKKIVRNEIGSLRDVLGKPEPSRHLESLCAKFADVASGSFNSVEFQPSEFDVISDGFCRERGVGRVPTNRIVMQCQKVHVEM